MILLAAQAWNSSCEIEAEDIPPDDDLFVAD